MSERIIAKLQSALEVVQHVHPDSPVKALIHDALALSYQYEIHTSDEQPTSDHPVPSNERGRSWFGNDGIDCCITAP